MVKITDCIVKNSVIKFRVNRFSCGAEAEVLKCVQVLVEAVGDVHDRVEHVEGAEVLTIVDGGILNRFDRVRTEEVA